MEVKIGDKVRVYGYSVVPEGTPCIVKRLDHNCDPFTRRLEDVYCKLLVDVPSAKEMFIYIPAELLYPVDDRRGDELVKMASGRIDDFTAAMDLVGQVKRLLYKGYMLDDAAAVNGSIALSFKWSPDQVLRSKGEL